MIHDCRAAVLNRMLDEPGSSAEQFCLLRPNPPQLGCLGPSGEIAMHWAENPQTFGLDLLGLFWPD